MKTVSKLTLTHDDQKAAFIFWVEGYHGLAYNEDSGDKVGLPRHVEDVTITLKDDLV